MNVNASDRVLHVSGWSELTAATAHALVTTVQSAIDHCTIVEIDLSEVAAMDCCGVGALISVRNVLRLQAAQLRLLNPSPAVQRLIHATGTASLLDSLRSEEPAPAPIALPPGLHGADADAPICRYDGTAL